MRRGPRLSSLLILVLPLLLWGCGGDSGPTAPPGGGGGGNEATTALVGDGGASDTTFTSYEQVSLSLAGLSPSTLYTVEVRDAAKTLRGRYELTTDGDGNMDPSAVLYDPEPGTYTVDVLDTDITFTVQVGEPQRLFFTPCDEAGNHVNNVETGETVFLKGSGGTPGATAAVYVVPGRVDWEPGMYLYDYTESVEELTFDAEGGIPPTPIWEQAANGEAVAWDVIVDMDGDGLYSEGDYVDGKLGVGFVVQDPDPGKTVIDGHVVERLSCGADFVYRDLFDVTDNVYVYLNPVAKMRNLGGDRYVRWYIVPHQDTWNDQDPLNPVRTPLGDTVQNGCTNAGRRLLWPARLSPGRYDIVIDVDHDGKYDKGQDILDGYSGPGDWVGFTVQETPRFKDWTLLVYADGEGGLSGTRSEYASEISDYMNDDMYAAVLFDGDDSAGYTECRRYICTPDSVIVDREYDELNMGQPLTLHDFLVWGITRFPAVNYMVVLSNHGGSWFKENHPVPNELDYNEPNKAICYDGGDGLNMYELEYVFRDIKALAGKLDVIWYQGCLMGGVEVAAVSKDYFRYMVSHETVRYGSENTNKFPNVVQFLRGAPDADAAADKCVTAPTAPRSSYCASYDLSRYGALEQAIREFVDTALAHEDFDSFKSDLQDALSNVRRVGPPAAGDLEPYMQNGDIADFFDRVAMAKAAVPGDVAAAATAVSVKAGLMVHTSMGNVGGTPGLNGVAIWLPRTAQEFNNYAAEYAGFDFAANTRWLDFLAKLYGVAYRIELTWGAEPRDLDSHLYDANGNHLVYYNMSIPGADLDRDDVDGYGPENVRISYLVQGAADHYEYKVRLYAGDGQNGSLSTVKVFRGGGANPVKTYFRTWNDGNRGWHVFNIMTADGSIVDVDQVYPNIPNKDKEHPKR